MKFITTIGGTFNAMHQGHKEYIELAVKLSSELYILLKDSEYAQKEKLYTVKSNEVRKKQIKDFIGLANHSIHLVNSERSVVNNCLNDKISLAIVIPEYYDLFRYINRLRLKKKKKQFLILIKERTLLPNELDLDSTALTRANQIK